MNIITMHNFIALCGALHIILALTSLSIPKLLGWRQGLHTLPPLLRQMFWTYAGYILFINVWFGIISLIGTDALLNHSILAKSITLFIALYWAARVAIQFFYFDRSEAPRGIQYVVGEAALVSLFLLFAGVYSVAFFHNIA